MKDQEIPLIVIAGPTGVGKTDLSIQLAKQFRGQVINADSIQVYQGLDIGSGKITSEEMQGVPHHLLDVIKPEETYDAKTFQEVACQLIRQIYQTGHLPILVGGTGLYLEGVLYQMEFGGQESFDPGYRQFLQERLQHEGASRLWQDLQVLDPEAGQKIPIQNERRIIRALEVIHHTGKKFSDQSGHQDQNSRFNELLLVVNRPRQDLYDRINQRVLTMVDQGLEEEVARLLQLENGRDLPCLKAIGYKEWLPYFAGHINRQEVVEAIQNHSRHYAKRQLTWFRNRMKNPYWLDASDPQYEEVAKQVVEDFLVKSER